MAQKIRNLLLLCLMLFVIATLQGMALASGFSVLIQAEDMALTPAMVVGSDAAAFGGAYIHVPEGSDTRSPVAEAEIAVSVPADGTYQLWARLHGPDGNSDAVYLTIDDEAWSRKWPSETGVYEWVQIAGYNLKAGSHQLKVSHGEIRARFDAFFLTDDSNAVPPETERFAKLVEAENMTLTSAMAIGSDASASNGKYIHVPTGSDTRSPEVEAEAAISVPADGTYYLWMSLCGPDKDSDAMYATIDNFNWTRKYPSTTEVWEWLLVGKYELKAGSHQLKVGHGEIRTRVDALYLTDDPNDKPM